MKVPSGSYLVHNQNDKAEYRNVHACGEVVDRYGTSAPTGSQDIVPITKVSLGSVSCKSAQSA